MPQQPVKRKQQRTIVKPLGNEENERSYDSTNERTSDATRDRGARGPMTLTRGFLYLGPRTQSR